MTSDVFYMILLRHVEFVIYYLLKSNQSILKEISPGYSLEELMLELKLQYFGHLIQRLIWKDPGAGKDWGKEEKGTTEVEMVGWHHWLNGHGFGWTLGVGDGQGGLACCSSWDFKEWDTAEWLNWTENPFSWLHCRQYVADLVEFTPRFSCQVSPSTVHSDSENIAQNNWVWDYQGWNRSPAQVGCIRQVLGPGALGRPRGIGWRGRWEGGLGWGTHVNPWLINFNVWQNPLQYCKVISLQLIKKIKLN